MKESLKRMLLPLGLLLLVSATAGFPSEITLTLIPANGDVSGPAGLTAGWGYTITNSSPNWLEALSLSAGSFIDGTPNAIFDFPDVGPNSSVTEDFSLATTALCSSPSCGLYEFTWNNKVPAGTVNSGTFIVAFDYFKGNPANPSSIDLGPAPDADADYSVSVSPAAAPEPGTPLLLLTGVCGLILYKERAHFCKCSARNSRL